MAYVKKEDLIVIKSEKQGKLTAIVTDIQFRKFKKFYKDKKTGENRYKIKSVPYPVCKIISSTFDKHQCGEEFVIAGYKLRNHVLVKTGEKCLILENEYLAEFETGGEEWVSKILSSSRKKVKK